MRRFLKALVGCALALALLLLLLPVALPQRAHVERSILIRSSPEAVFAVVSDLGQTASWDPWASVDPSLDVRVEGTGVGATYEWQGLQAGHGRSTLVSLETPSRVTTRVEVFQPMHEQFMSEVRMESHADGTRVTWSLDQDLTYFMRYIGLCMDNYLGPSFEVGLSRLKLRVEQPAGQVAERAAAEGAGDAVP